MERPLLITDDDAAMARSLQRFFSRQQPVVVASSVTAAKELIAGPTRWRGAIVDIQMPDGSGLSVLDAFRERWWTAPALVLTGSLDADTINRAQALGAQFAIKPTAVENLRAFNARLLATGNDADIDATVAQLAEEFDLSANERRILGAAAHGVSREELAAAFDVTENTIKTQVRSLVRKCGQYALADVARLVWRRSGT